MACDPQKITSAQHSQFLLLLLAASRHFNPVASCTHRAVPEASGAGGKPDSGDHRQPERQGRRKARHTITDPDPAKRPRAVAAE